MPPGAPLNFARWIIVTSSRTQASVPTRSACMRFRSADELTDVVLADLFALPGLATSAATSASESMRADGLASSRRSGESDRPAASTRSQLFQPMLLAVEHVFGPAVETVRAPRRAPLQPAKSRRRASLVVRLLT